MSRAPFGIPEALYPPIAIPRLLDDLHEVAKFFMDFGPRMEQLTKLGEQLDASIRAAIPIAEAVNSTLKTATPVAEAVDASMKAALPLLELLQKQIEMALPLLDKLEPIAKRAVDVVGPLEGATERLGRMIDRFPGRERGRAGPRHRTSRSSESRGRRQGFGLVRANCETASSTNAPAT